MKELQTERLILRYFRPDDVDPIHCLIYNDPEVYRWWGGASGTREEVEDRVLTWMSTAPGNDFGNLAVVLKANDQAIGFMALQNYVASWVRLADDPTSPYNSLEVELSYVLGRPYWGKGYAYEACLAMRDYAFRDLGLRRLLSCIEPENARSIALAQRLGFRAEPNLHPSESHPVWILDNDLL